MPSERSAMVSTYANSVQIFGGGGAPSAGICMLCQRSACWACQRCGDFYCSPDCQRRDWQRHRYICSSMPGLMPASVTNMEIAKFSPRSATSSSPPLAIARNGGGQLALPAPDPPAEIVSQDVERKLSACSLKEVPATSVKMSHNFNTTPSKQPVGVMTPPPMTLPKINDRVLLTGFRSPNVVYVRSLSAAETDAYLLAVKKIDAYGKMAPSLTALPKVHSYAIAQAEGLMCRVEILAVRGEDDIQVQFCDYGTTAVRQLRGLRMISDDILRLQQHAVAVQLRNVENYPVNDKVMSLLALFVDGEYQIRYGEEDERGGSVELYDLQSKKCLNEVVNHLCLDKSNYAEDKGARPRVLAASSKNEEPASGTGSVLLAGLRGKSEAKAADKGAVLVDIGLDASASNAGAVGGFSLAHMKSMTKSETVERASSVLAKSNSGEDPVLLAPFEVYMFKLHSTSFKAVVLDTSALDYGYIGCIAEADLKYLIEVQEALTKFKDTNKPYRPQLREYCIARYESEWYRARVLGIPDATRYAVVYLDFTNESILTSEDIRRYPADLKGDCRTNVCLIDGLPSKLNAEHVKFLKKEITTESRITIDRVKEVVQQMVVVECRSVIDKMRAQGLL